MSYIFWTYLEKYRQCVCFFFLFFTRKDLLTMDFIENTYNIIIIYSCLHPTISTAGLSSKGALHFGISGPNTNENQKSHNDLSKFMIFYS